MCFIIDQNVLAVVVTAVDLVLAVVDLMTVRDKRWYENYAQSFIFSPIRALS